MSQKFPQTGLFLLFALLFQIELPPQSGLSATMLKNSKNGFHPWVPFQETKVWQPLDYFHGSPKSSDST